MAELKPIAETQNFIVLDKYTKIDQANTAFQSEASLERELIADLQAQGYVYRKDITNPEALLANVREKIEKLNSVNFSNEEWARFNKEYLDNPSDTHTDKMNKIHNDYIYDFVFDDGHIKNIYLLNKKNLAKNALEVVSQFEQTGTNENRYDVSILVNGLPLVHIELKKRGESIREAFNQVHRYSKESFNSEQSLYKYVQMFVISNGTDTRYFANTTKRDKNSFEFTMNWARSDNKLIKDLKDFTATFFSKNVLLNILINYSVFDVNENLLIMRPYQIAATERILWKIKSAYQAKQWHSIEGGGYIWHTTGSGKTLTSFKAARLATQLDFIDKVFFVVDRKDLDDQTMKEYKKFSPDSVNGSNSTKELKENLEKADNKIVVTTIQKLNNLIKSENDLQVYNKQVVFIFDEAHRSQFGEAQINIAKRFKKYYQFGFTGTPIFPENALGSETTASVFGRELHSYVITDAIRDEKVLKFKVDYNNIRPKFKSIECEQDELKLSAAETKEALLHPERIKEIAQYILNNFRIKTHRNNPGAKGFNAMFAVSSVDAAKAYYEAFAKLQENCEKPLKIATIFSFAANEEQSAIGEISDESFQVTAMNSSAKEFIEYAIVNFNNEFKTNFGVDSKEFQNYYRDISKRVINQEIDLLIVVGMFLTGFDAPALNTLFVDKNLRFHGLIQAFSRTNRIYDSTKSFGNIVTFRDLEHSTIEAITLFGDKNTKNIVLEKSYKEYMEGFTDIATGEAKRGYIDVVKDLNDRFADIENIQTDKNKKEFVQLFGEYLRIENILQNYDEFASLKSFQLLDSEDEKAMEEFKQAHYLTDDDIEVMKTISVPNERQLQDYRSTYNDIRDWLRKERANSQKDDSDIDWNDVVFEFDIMRTQEINLDYILQLIFEKNRQYKSKDNLLDDIRRVIRSSTGNRAKESLIVDFVHATDLDEIDGAAGIIEAFFLYAQQQQSREAGAIIAEENLNEEAAKRYITVSLKKEFASDNGTELNESLPKMSPLNPGYQSKKQAVFEKISAFVEKFKGVGGEV